MRLIRRTTAPEASMPPDRNTAIRTKYYAKLIILLLAAIALTMTGSVVQATTTSNTTTDNATSQISPLQFAPDGFVDPTGGLGGCRTDFKDFCIPCDSAFPSGTCMSLEEWQLSGGQLAPPQPSAAAQAADEQFLKCQEEGPASEACEAGATLATLATDCSRAPTAIGRAICESYPEHAQLCVEDPTNEACAAAATWTPSCPPGTVANPDGVVPECMCPPGTVPNPDDVGPVCIQTAARAGEEVGEEQAGEEVGEEQAGEEVGEEQAGEEAAAPTEEQAGEEVGEEQAGEEAAAPTEEQAGEAGE